MNNLEQTEKPNNRPVITGIIILLILASLSCLALKINSKNKQEQTVTISETDTKESDTHQNISNSTDPSTPTGLSEEEKQEILSIGQEALDYISKSPDERIATYNDLTVVKEAKKRVSNMVQDVNNFFSMSDEEQVRTFQDNKYVKRIKENKSKEEEQKATDHIPSNSTDPSTSTGLSEEEREQIYGTIIEFSDYLSKPIEEQVGKSKDLTTVKNYEKRKAEQEEQTDEQTSSTSEEETTISSIWQEILDFFQNRLMNR